MFENLRVPLRNVLIYILYNLGQKKIPLGTKGRTSILSVESSASCGAVQGFSVLSLWLTSFFDFWDKKRPSTFRTVRPVNGLIFGIYFSKLAGGEQHFMLFADGKSTRDSRFSGARGCSHLDGAKWRNILGHAAFFCWQRMKLRRTHILPIGEYRSAPFSS